MKPDWSSPNVPEWATFAAQEASGSWYFYEFRPVYSELCTEWQTKGRRQIIPKVELRPQATLEERPVTVNRCQPVFDNPHGFYRCFEISQGVEYTAGPINWIKDAQPE
jgi:hypothetical protein